MKTFFLPPLLLVTLPFMASAGTVLYTTHEFAPQNADDTVEVVYLDAADRFQDDWFLQQGVELSEAKAPQIIALLQSPEWQAGEQELTRAYQGIIRAWQLGVERVPAVVEDDRWVVYGLTDLSRAHSEIRQFQQQRGERQ